MTMRPLPRVLGAALAGAALVALGILVAVLMIRPAGIFSAGRVRRV